MSARRTRAATGPRPAVASLRDRPSCDVLIIGGGVNGVATFRDLALQGVDVTLIDRGDLAAATSAASSRMIHGGLRYLENGEFRLVREAVAERNDLLATAPHHVRPLPTTVPIRTTWAGLAGAPRRFLTGHGPARRAPRGVALIELGLRLYDSYSHAGRAADGTGVPRHRLAGREQTRRELPDLHPATRWTATYYDACVRAPERLVLEMALDALAANPRARVATYAAAVGMDGGDVAVEDLLTGMRVPVAARVVVNATGPWVDLTQEALGEHTAWLGGTKGSHLVLDNPALLAACAGREIFFENEDGRIVLVYPQHGRVIVGTSDLPADPREPARCTEEEVDYFLDLVAHVFPDIPVSRADIVFRYAGIRPLPRADAATPGEIPRDYRLEDGTLPGTEVPLVTIVGGKWTTMRALGERAADRVLGLLGETRRVSTRGLPIGGGAGFPVDDARDGWIDEHLPGVPLDRARTLLDRYGTRAVEVAAAESVPGGMWARLWGADPGARLADAPDVTRGEIAWIARHERVARLADVVLRRTTLAFEGRVTEALLDDLADVVGEELGWTRRRRRAEVDAVRAILGETHGVEVARGRAGAGPRRPR
ncbi:glycerol-3-phosphate dehydrogenase/oxidase [Demequina sp. SYSU T00068]|uniref:glycerol-3-phosphate dehydrogenase/oxidase n=1 Tax=Demequina lignilytica TaxID=3051663 RepID=UPI0026059F88|nr:glycerol-3-phosphate dehydrogenase/oxidase [Demequina sp. SYSU T00068]MDN4491198.1 glycerol-3-phosphate dehydrogenase/oxidase [Demequina sp. SYSU T00068]